VVGFVTAELVSAIRHPMGRGASFGRGMFEEALLDMLLKDRGVGGGLNIPGNGRNIGDVLGNGLEDSRNLEASTVNSWRFGSMG
jgi:hypothetical protein